MAVMDIGGGDVVAHFPGSWLEVSQRMAGPGEWRVIATRTADTPRGLTKVMLGVEPCEVVIQVEGGPVLRGTALCCGGPGDYEFRGLGDLEPM